MLLELAATVLAIAIAARLLFSPTRDALQARACRQLRRRRQPMALVVERRPTREVDGHPYRRST